MIAIKKAYFSILSAALLLLPALASAVTPLEDPLNLGPNPLPALANRLITAALGIAGVLALIAFIYGGILYLLAGVNPKNVEKGKDLMKYAVIGLFVIFSSYAVVNFLLKSVFVVPQSAGTPSGQQIPLGQPGAAGTSAGALCPDGVTPIAVSPGCD